MTVAPVLVAVFYSTDFSLFSETLVTVTLPDTNK